MFRSKKSKCIQLTTYLQHHHVTVTSLLTISKNTALPQDIFKGKGFGRWCGSAAWTSVFGWQTFPDLRLIYGWHVTTSWESVHYGSTNQVNSAFHPFGDGKWVAVHVITCITGVKTIKRQTWAVYGCLVIVQSVGAGLAYNLKYRLYACSCLWQQCCCSCSCHLWCYIVIMPF